MYMDWYIAGYRSGLTGTSITCCFPRGPFPTAQSKGWYAGQLAGQLAGLQAKESLEQEKP
jgi:hypothetical protein